MREPGTAVVNAGTLARDVFLCCLLLTLSPQWALAQAGAIRICGTIVRPDVRELDLSGRECVPGDLGHLVRLSKLTQLDLSGSSVADGHLRAMPALPTLGKLSLANTKITNSGLRKLARFDALEQLDTGDNEGLTGSGLAHLAALPRLKRIRLSTGQITDIGMSHLGRLEALRAVESDVEPDRYDPHPRGCSELDGCFDLRGGAVSARGLSRLETHPVRFLLMDHEDVTDDVLGVLHHVEALKAFNCHGIHRRGEPPLQLCLDIETAENVTPAGLRKLRGMRVEYLFMGAIPAESLRLVTGIPGLKTLNCRQCLASLHSNGACDNGWEVTDYCVDISSASIDPSEHTALAGLKRMSRIEHLVLPEKFPLTLDAATVLTAIPNLENRGFRFFVPTGSAAALEKLARAGDITWLHLSGPGVTDTAVGPLLKLGKLERLSVKSKALTSTGVAKLLELPALVHLEVPPSTISAAIVPALARHGRLRYLNYSHGQCEQACVMEQGCAHHDSCWDDASRSCRRMCKGGSRDLFLNLEDAPLARSDLKSLETVSKQLRLYWPGSVDDVFLEKLVGLSNLSAFNCPSARCLDFSGFYEAPPAKITRRGVEQLRKLSGIEVVNLPPELIDDDSIEVLATLPKLKALNSGFEPKGLFSLGASLTVKGLEHLAKHSGVEGLSIPHELITDSTLKLLRTFPRLKSLNCSATKRWVSTASSPSWRDGLVPCIRLDSEGVTSAGLKALEGFTRTRTFVIEPELIDDGTLRLLASMPHVDSVNCIYDDDPYRQPCAIPSCIDLAGTSVTEKGLAVLRRHKIRHVILPDGMDTGRARKLLRGGRVHDDETPLVERSCGQ